MSKNFADDILKEAGMGAPATTVPSTTVPATEPATTVPATTEPATTVPTTQPATTIPGTTEPATTVPAGTTEPATTVIPPTTTPVSDEELLKSLIQKGVLKEGQTLADLLPKPTEEETARKNKELADNAIKHFIAKGTLDLDKYNQYVAEKGKAPAELAFESFKSKFLEDIKGTAEEGTYTDQDISDMYAKRGYSQKEEQRMANDYLKSKYSDLNESDIVSSYQREQEQTQLATAYKGTVEKAIELLPTQIMLTIGDEQIPYTPTKEAVEHVKSIYLNETSFNTFGKVDAKSLSDAMIINIKQHNLDLIIKEAAEAYATKMVEKVSLGRRGLNGDLSGNEGHGGAAGSGGGKKASGGHADSILDAATKQKK